MIREICHDITVARANEIEIVFLDTCSKYGIVSPTDKVAFLAQIAHESGEFTIKQERMNYTTPQRIVDVWPSRFNLSGTDGKLNAHDYTGNAEKLANEVYANRMGNVDAASGDGYKYRGGGFLQLTGKGDYIKYAAYICKTIEETADMIHTDDHWAMDSAAWEYVIVKRLLGETDILKITKAVNGGTNGLAERRKYYLRGLEVIV